MQSRDSKSNKKNLEHQIIKQNNYETSIYYFSAYYTHEYGWDKNECL